MEKKVLDIKKVAKGNPYIETVFNQLKIDCNNCLAVV